jgi:CBS domain-containing protein
MRRHPILVSEVISADGARRCDRRVFCDVRGHSVSLDVCRGCASRVAIDDGETDAGVEASVHCSPALEATADAPSPTGAALRRGVVAVDESVLVRDVVTLFVERGVQLIVVTDAAGHAEGVVHESQLVREIRDHAFARANKTHLRWESVSLEPASALMRSAPTVLEAVPLRSALADMAGAHQRHLVVVDDDGFPIGVLVDVDALHALYTSTHDRDA